MSGHTLEPYRNVLASVVTYSLIFNLFSLRDRSYTAVRTRIKAISACHSLFACYLTCTSLLRDWKIAADSESSSGLGYNGLNDSQNPLIAGTNTLANFVTAWEAGYLIYDTGALCFESAAKKRTRDVRPVLVGVLRDSPVSILHHLVLASALLYLQTYIVRKRERGVKVIMAFFLMNASTPLLHLRWWRRKVTGRRNRGIDLALAAVFAITRFGSIYWAIAEYGQYHKLSPWNALSRQRAVCQTGTGLLTGLNAVWWFGLVSQMARRKKEK